VSPGLQLRGFLATDFLAGANLLVDAIDRSHQLDFFDGETEIFQHASCRQGIDMDIGLTHGFPQQSE
jgi:hypothetical protein